MHPYLIPVYKRWIALPCPLRVALQLYSSPRYTISVDDSAPSSTRRNHLPAFCAAFHHPSNLIPKADISSFRCTTHSFSCPPEWPLPPTSSSNTTLCGRRSSPIRATNPASNILRLRTVASMLSEAVLASESAYERLWSYRALSVVVSSFAGPIGNSF